MLIPDEDYERPRAIDLFPTSSITLSIFLFAVIYYNINEAIASLHVPSFKSSNQSYDYINGLAPDSVMLLTESKESQNTSKPSILLWTPSIVNTNLSSNSLTLILQEMARICPYSCQLDTRDKIKEKDAHAIIFHSLTMLSNDLPIERRPDQIYFWLCHERPDHCGYQYKKLDKYYFNNTITNLRDGISYHYGYGEIVRTNNEKMLRRINDEEFNSIYGKKKHLGLAVISHCDTDSKREVYLRALSQHANLTLIGDCYRGLGKDCPKGRDGDICLEELFTSHYFYFSFENGVCQDYVSEKFFDRLWRNIVPIVLRRSIYKGIAPDSSFIAADDFKSPQELIEYLRKVASDPILYRRYFTWREEYALDSSLTINGNGICELCKDLHNKSVRSSDQFDLPKYYNYNRLCEYDVGWKLLL